MVGPGARVGGARVQVWWVLSEPATVELLERGGHAHAHMSYVPSNSASEEMPESSQQSPTLPCLMSEGSTSPMIFRLGK